MQTLEKYQDTLLKILVVIVTGFAGYIATTSGNLRLDSTLMVWGVLILICIIGLTTISSTARHEESKIQSDKSHAETIERLDKQDELFSLLLRSQQQTMRANLVHLAEKYLSRGWLTSEELKAYVDMYNAYSELGLNGYIKTYMDKLNALDIRTLDEMAKLDEKK